MRDRLSPDRRGPRISAAGFGREEHNGRRISGQSCGYQRRQPRHRACDRRGLRARGCADGAGVGECGQPRQGGQGDRGCRRTCAAHRRRRSAHACRLRAGVQGGERQIQALRRSGQQCRRHARRQFLRAAGRGLRRRLCAEIFRRGAADAAVLAAVEGGAWLRSSTSSAARRARRVPEFLIGGSVNSALANFSKGLAAHRQPRRRQCQRHPSRHGGDRPRGHAVSAIRQGAEQDAGGGAQGRR